MIIKPIFQIEIPDKNVTIDYTITPRNTYYNRDYQPIINKLDLSKDPNYWTSPPVYKLLETANYAQYVNNINTEGITGDNYVFNIKSIKPNETLFVAGLPSNPNHDPRYGTNTWMSDVLVKPNWFAKTNVTLAPNLVLYTEIENDYPRHIYTYNHFTINEVDHPTWNFDALSNGSSSQTTVNKITEGAINITTLSTLFIKNNKIVNGSWYLATYHWGEISTTINSLEVKVPNSTGYVIKPVVGKHKTILGVEKPMSSYFTTIAEVEAITNASATELFPAFSSGGSYWEYNNITSAFKQTELITTFKQNENNFKRIHLKGTPSILTNYVNGIYKNIPTLVVGSYYIISFYARSMNSICNKLQVTLENANNVNGGLSFNTPTSNTPIQLTDKWILYTLKVKVNSIISNKLKFYSDISGDDDLNFELANISVKAKNNPDYLDECYQDVFCYYENMELKRGLVVTTPGVYTEQVLLKQEGQYLPYPNKNIIGTFRLDNNSVFVGDSINSLVPYDSVNTIGLNPSLTIRI